MKLIAIFLLCGWITVNTEINPEAQQRNLQVRSLLPEDYVKDDCDIDYVRSIEITHWNSLNVFRYLMEHPLARWDCFLYKQMKEKNKKESDIAKIEPRIAIFSWLERYDSETENAKDKISINSIIACAFWPVTGLPTFIALVLLFMGQDEPYIKEKSELPKEQNVHVSQSEQAPLNAEPSPAQGS